MITPTQKAHEYCATFRTVLGFTRNSRSVKDCAKACADKLCVEVTGNVQRYEYFQAVKAEIDNVPEIPEG